MKLWENWVARNLMDMLYNVVPPSYKWLVDPINYSYKYHKP